MSEIRTGSCLCGNVTYKINGPLDGVITCHCTQCRKQTGHYYAAARTREDCFEVSDPNSLITWYKASQEASRGFCSQCGSALFWKRDGSGYMSVLVGSIDGDTNLTYSEHIYLKTKGDYYSVEEGAPKFELDDTSS